MKLSVHFRNNILVFLLLLLVCVGLGLKKREIFTNHCRCFLLFEKDNNPGISDTSVVSHGENVKLVAKDSTLQLRARTRLSKLISRAKPILSLPAIALLVNTEKSQAMNSSNFGADEIAAIIKGLQSDELLVTFNSTSLGLGLTEIEYHNQKRIVVNRINPDILNPYLQSLVRKGMIVVAINGENIEGMPLKEFSQFVNSNLQRPIYVTFRDPSVFFQLLRQRSKPYEVISTTLLPKNRYTNNEEEVLTVEKYLNPEIQTSQLKNLTTCGKGDVLEILYQVQLFTTRNNKPVVMQSPFRVIDGVKNHTMLEPGYGNVQRLYEDSLFLLLGSDQKEHRYSSFKNNNIENDFDGGLLNYLPFRWENLLTGMAVGDERRLYLPSGYYQQKQFSRLIQSNQLAIDIKVLSINGISV